MSPRQLFFIPVLFSFSFVPLFAGTLARDFFDDTTVQDVSLTVDPNDWATLQKNYLEDTYYPAQFTWRGTTLTVGIRSRGRGSRSPDKPNLDVNIDKYVKKQRFLGLAFFVLKANNQDASAMHETISFKLFQRMGLPAPREAPARVSINGQYLGFFTIVEHEDEDFLTRNFGENDGDLYEWEPAALYHFEYLGDDPSVYAPFLDPKTNEDNPDFAAFADMVRAINQSSDADFRSAVSQYLDIKLYLTHAAIENVLSEIDGILGDTYGMNNFYLYRFEGQKLSQFIVWDKDLTFQNSARPILQNVYDDVLARRAMAIPELRNTYLEALVKAATLLGGSNGWGMQELDRQYALIHDAATNDPHKQCIRETGTLYACGPREFENEVAHVQSFLASRADFVVAAAKAAGYSAPTGAPTIQSSSITGAAAQASGVLVPGSLTSIFGQNLFGSQTAQADATPLPRTLAGAFLAVNGARAPLVMLSSGQINAQLPWDLPMGQASVVAVLNGTQSNTLQITVGDAAPAVFAVAHADGSLVSADQPTQSGEPLIAYATGLGEVSADLNPGEAAPSDPLATMVNMPELSVSGAPAQVLFSGLAPGFVGLYQINFLLPEDVPSGATVPLSIDLNGQSASSSLDIR